MCQFLYLCYTKVGSEKHSQKGVEMCQTSANINFISHIRAVNETTEPL